MTHTLEQNPSPDQSDVRVRVWGPGSLSNLGPGFDALGLCLRGIGDIVEAWRTDALGVDVLPDEDAVGWTPPLDPAQNTAAVAAAAVLRQAGATHGIAMRIRKGLPPGSGLGSSAASAVAGGWATNLLLDAPLTKPEVVGAMLAGERVASGALHGDNVLPALFGGLILVDPDEPTRHRRIELPRALPLAVILPKVQVFTKEARAMLPAQVPLREAVRNAAALGFMIDAFHAGDWETVARSIMSDRLVEPVRARLVPCYEAVRAAASEAGALGCALSGSGPALFAIAETPDAAARVMAAMRAAAQDAGIDAEGWVCEADPEGVRAMAP